VVAGGDRWKVAATAELGFGVVRGISHCRTLMRLGVAVRPAVGSEVAGVLPRPWVADGWGQRKEKEEDGALEVARRGRGGAARCGAMEKKTSHGECQVGHLLDGVVQVASNNHPGPTSQQDRLYAWYSLQRYSGIDPS
jgi:hypothetical protein